MTEQVIPVEMTQVDAVGRPVWQWRLVPKDAIDHKKGHVGEVVFHIDYSPYKYPWKKIVHFSDGSEMTVAEYKQWLAS